ncbi:MAG TPA: hypothetical protein VLD37_03820 [Candidatus Bilamarchaeum sp.]|nr:hypothetical protein [Candidatus Bilamarchaeum sp.]
MHAFRQGTARKMYPEKPRFILLEQPSHLMRDNWAAEDPRDAAEAFARMLSYSKEAGVPVFSTHPSGYRGAGESGIIPIDIHGSGTGFVLSDCSSSPFLDSVMDRSGGPVIVGGAHARIGRGSGPLRFLRPSERLISGICLMRPLAFLQAMKEAGLLNSEIFLDPRLTVQLGTHRLDPSWLYGVCGRTDEGFRIRQSVRLEGKSY